MLRCPQVTTGKNNPGPCGPKPCQGECGNPTPKSQRSPRVRPNDPWVGGYVDPFWKKKTA